MQLKKSKTYKEQVEILRNKGLKINDSGNVSSFLNHVNYYRFSGYFLPFISKTDKKFHDGTSFEQLENIYHFDSELRKLIMGTIDECPLFLNPFTPNYVIRGKHIKAQYLRSMFKLFAVVPHEETVVLLTKTSLSTDNYRRRISLSGLGEARTHSA